MIDLTSAQDAAIFFDDLRQGAVYRTAARTVTEADIVNFAALSADYNSLHVDAEFASQSRFGQRVAHGLLVLALTSGLTTRLPLIIRMGSALQGLLDVNCRWTGPTFIGDTIHAVVTIERLRATSSGDRGVVDLKRDAVNQRGETVMESMWKMLVSRRPPDGAVSTGM